MMAVKKSCLQEPFLPRFVCKIQALKELVPCILEGKKKENVTEEKNRREISGDLGGNKDLRLTKSWGAHTFLPGSLHFPRSAMINDFPFSKHRPGTEGIKSM